ncbi:MAG: hypothetical protein ACXWR0_09775 [Bdellovibrio sp.]
MTNRISKIFLAFFYLISLINTASARETVLNPTFKSVGKDLVSEISKLPVGQVFIYKNLDNDIIKTQYSGLYSLQGVPCEELSDSCIPFTVNSQNLGPATPDFEKAAGLQSGQLVSPLDVDAPSSSPGNLSGNSSTAPIDSSINGPGNGDNTGASNNAQSGSDSHSNSNSNNGNNESSGNGNGNGVVNGNGATSSEDDGWLPGLSGSLQSGAAAGAVQSIVSIFIDEKLSKAQIIEAQAKENYSQAYDQNIRIQVRNANEVRSLTNTIANIQQVSLLSLPNLAQNYTQSIPGVEQASQYDSAYQDRLKKVTTSLSGIQVSNNPLKNDLKEIGIASVKASLESRLFGWIEVSEEQMKIAEKITSILLTLNPITDTSANLYAFLTGKDFVSGAPLSNAERALSGAFAALNIATAGAGTPFAKSLKAIGMIAERMNPRVFKSASVAFDAAKKIVKVLTTKGLNTFGELKNGLNFLKKQNLKNLAEIEEGILETEIKQGISEGKILKDIEFSKKFIGNPNSPEAINYLKNGFAPHGLRPAKIYPGNTDAIYVIGRKMGTPISPGVSQYTEELQKMGFNAHQLTLEEPVLTELANGKILNGGQNLTAEQLQNGNFKAWQENEKYITDAIGTEGHRPTIIDLGEKAGDGHSPFYHDLELARLKKERPNFL